MNQYDDWKLMSPEDEREHNRRYSFIGEGSGDHNETEPDDIFYEPTELDLVYQDLHEAQALINEMYAALRLAENVLGERDISGIALDFVRDAILKAEALK